MPGAIVIAGRESGEEKRDLPGSSLSLAIERRQRFLAGVELLGQSVFGRLVRQLLDLALEKTAIFVDSSLTLDFDDLSEVDGYTTSDMWRAAERSLIEAKEAGVNDVLVVRAGAYVEFDPVELLQFHKANGNSITRACDGRGALDVWVVDAGIVEESRTLPASLYGAGEPYYPVTGYVNRMENLRDLRRLVADGLNSRCAFRPRGFEMRPGVWMAEGAQVERGARIVAPCFIGRDVKVSEQCLITRCSNIESNCHIDYGTAVEDSSVLKGTYVGIGLDVSHSVVDGTCLLNLSREVMLEITDPVVMRQMRQIKPRAEGKRQLPSNFRHAEAALSAADHS